MTFEKKMRILKTNHYSALQTKHILNTFMKIRWEEKIVEI